MLGSGFNVDLEPVPALKESVFNYKYYSPERFLHYYQQIVHVLEYTPQTVLEIGPGDHTVTDFLRRKGIKVDTFDNDESLIPTYLGDIRHEMIVRIAYDLVLASEVFEHMNIKWLPQILENIKRVMVNNGILVVSLPYSTVKLFPRKKNNGERAGLISCEGRLSTAIPLYNFYAFIHPLRIFYKLLIKRSGLKEALAKLEMPSYPDDEFNVHHWDLGIRPTTRKFVRKIFERYFSVLDEKIYLNTNCVFYILKK